MILSVIEPMKKKPLICIPVLVLSLTIAGCTRSYQESQLVGVWQSTGEPKGFKLTFGADHTCTFAAVSPKNLTQYGEWALAANQLTITLRSNNWTTVTTSNRGSYRVIELTDSTLTLKDPHEDTERPDRFIKVR